MSRKTCLYLFILLFSGILVGCTTKNFFIEDMNLEFTNIEVRDGTTGNMVSLDEKQSEELYNYLKKIGFTKGKSPKQITGWSYALDFMADGKVTDTIVIQDETTIGYKNYFYKSNNIAIDLDYLASFFKYTFKAVVIDNSNGLLVKPEADTNGFTSSDKISVGTNNTIIYDEDKKEVDLSEIQIGDSIKVTYNGNILESYPAQISADCINILKTNLLIDGYIAIIDDIYKDDSALNNDINMIVLDLTGITNLSETDKDILLVKLYDMYGLEVKESTYDRLVEEGLINEKELYFPTGIIISISNSEYKESKKTLTYDIKKWRSGLGAIGYEGNVKFNGEEWIITKKNMWIS